jgi:hypothetical protein
MCGRDRVGERGVKTGVDTSVETGVETGVKTGVGTGVETGVGETQAGHGWGDGCGRDINGETGVGRET